MRIYTLAIISVGSLILVGCAATPQKRHALTVGEKQAIPQASTQPKNPEAPKAGSQPKTSSATKKSDYIQITPFTQLNPYNCTDEATGSSCVGLDTRFADAYTRLIIYGEAPLSRSPETTAQSTGDNATLLYNTRSFIARRLFGVHRTISLTAKVTVGSFAATVPLVTIDHVSNGTSGEAFSRAIYHRAENYPLFLVKRDMSDGIVSAQFIVKASNEAQSSAAGTALNLVQTVANFVAPPAPVLTTLTAQSTKNVATAIDQSISKLFSTTIDEEQWLDDDIRRWGNRVTITFKIPSDDSDWTAKPNRTIGEWTVAFANPRPSIFSDIEICPPRAKDSAKDKVRCGLSFNVAAAGAEYEVQNSPDQVLSFHLIGNQSNVDTIQRYLLQQDWYQKDVTAMAKASANSDALKDGAISFCRSIKGAIAGLGLNDVDAGIVTVAARKGLDLPTKIVDQMSKDAESCGFLYPAQQLAN